MKLEQSTIQRTFMINHKGKSYCVDYINSDGQTLRLLNRNIWEVFDEDGEEVDIYTFKSECKTKKEKEQIERNIELVEKIIGFCVKHFKDYQPELC